MASGIADMETNQPADTARIQEFGQWFNQCQTNEDLTRAAYCARDYYATGGLTGHEYEEVCVLGAKRRKELS